MTLPDLREDNEIWYKLKVLIHDLANIKSDPTAVARLERTVDELYISEPYFTQEEAGLLKGVLVVVSRESEDVEDMEVQDESGDEPDVEAMESRKPESKREVQGETETVEQAIKRRMANFYDKRKASGDFRPCGPHDSMYSSSP